MIFEINQGLLKGGQRVPLQLIQKAVSKVSQELGVDNKTSISIAFVSESDMRALNKKWRGKNHVTDVLSFPLKDSTNPNVAGEIIISYDQARRQAKQMRHSTRDEIIFLIIHGTLHLFGYDHESKVDAKNMFSLQEKILVSLGIDPRV